MLKLGTERHHSKLLKGIDSLDDVGCFGLTELGYGRYTSITNSYYKQTIVVIYC